VVWSEYVEEANTGCQPIQELHQAAQWFPPGTTIIGISPVLHVARGLQGGDHGGVHEDVGFRDDALVRDDKFPCADREGHDE